MLQEFDISARFDISRVKDGLTFRCIIIILLQESSEMKSGKFGDLWCFTSFVFNAWCGKRVLF